MPPRKKKAPPEQKFKDFATKFGTYILAIAAIIGGLRTIVVEFWPEKEVDPIDTLSAEETCPLFIGSIPEEDRFDVSLNKDVSLPLTDHRILLRFLDEIGVLGYMTISHRQSEGGKIIIHDVANDKCIGMGDSNYTIVSGTSIEMGLKENKTFALFMEVSSETSSLKLKLTQK